MRKVLFLQYALTAVVIAGFGLTAFGLLLVDFLFPGTVRTWSIFRGDMDLNLILLVVFGLQHSLMARRPFKAFMQKLLPSTLVQSTYVMWSGFTLFVLSLLWTPVSPPLYDIWGTPWGYAVLLPWILGAGIVAVSAFQVGGAELIGLNAVKAIWEEKPQVNIPFSRHGLHNVVRHPIYLGSLLIFWTSPTMTHDHLFFAEVMTAYVLVGIYFEERDLVKRFGEAYLTYQKEVPMLIPFTKRRPKRSS